MDKEINFDYEVTLKMRVKRSSIVKNIEKEEEKRGRLLERKNRQRRIQRGYRRS